METQTEPTIKVKTTYTDAHRIAQQKYREKNREAYNKSQRDLYDKLKQDDEWRVRFNARSKTNNFKYRDVKRMKVLEENPTIVFKGRGRPRKVVDTPISI
jgi:hypothetical protein